VPENGGSIWLGILIGIGVSVGGLLASVALMAGGGAFLLMGFGLTQLLWVIPLYLYFASQGQKETGKGILIVAGLVCLLNASCWGYFMSGRVRIGG